MISITYEGKKLVLYKCKKCNNKTFKIYVNPNDSWTEVQMCDNCKNIEDWSR